MKQAVLVAGALAVLVSCGRNGGTAASGAKTTSPPGGGGPVSCAEVPYGTVVPAADAIGEGKKAPVGITVRKGHGAYQIDEVRIEVLRPGTRVTQAPGEPDPFDAPHDDALKRVERTSVPASDTAFTVEFDGSDEHGARLPAGEYPVVFELTSSGRPGACDGPPARAYGVLTTIVWEG